MRKPIFILLFMATSVIGCKSEVDKCVESQLRAWMDKKVRDDAFWDAKERQMRKDLKSNDWEIVRIRDIRTKNEVEAEARLTCLSLLGKR